MKKIFKVVGTNTICREQIRLSVLVMANLIKNCFRKYDYPPIFLFFKLSNQYLNFVHTGNYYGKHRKCCNMYHKSGFLQQTIRIRLRGRRTFKSLFYSFILLSGTNRIEKMFFFKVHKYTFCGFWCCIVLEMRFLYGRPIVWLVGILISGESRRWHSLLLSSSTQSPPQRNTSDMADITSSHW